MQVFMEYEEKHLPGREELARLVLDTSEAQVEYHQAMRESTDRREIRDKVYRYYRLRDRLLEAARSILLVQGIKDT